MAESRYKFLVLAGSHAQDKSPGKGSRSKRFKKGEICTSHVRLDQKFANKFEYLGVADEADVEKVHQQQQRKKFDENNLILSR